MFSMGGTTTAATTGVADDPFSPERQFGHERRKS
jgi:hypothetical protein